MAKKGIPETKKGIPKSPKRGRPKETEVQQKKNSFLKKYMEIRDPVEAARAIGCKQPGKEARAMMADPVLAARIQRVEEKAITFAGVDAAHIVATVLKVLECCMQETISNKEKLDGSGLCYDYLDKKLALGCCELLSRYSGMTEKKTETTEVINVQALEEARQRVLSMTRDERLKALWGGETVNVEQGAAITADA